MKKALTTCITVFLALILVISCTASVLPVSAAETDEAIELTEGTYAPGQVVVLFKSSAIDTGSVPKKGELAPVGANLGEMMDASSSAREAYAAADEETDILSKSLGADFVLEDTLVFADAPDHEGKLPALGASDDASAKDELTVALVSSDKYDTATLIRLLGKNKNVVKAEPNYYVYPTSLDDYALNDPCNSYLYNVNSPAAENTDGEQVDDRGTDADEALSINASSGWKKLDGSEDEIVVAVVDTGVLAEHEDLSEMMWTNPGDIGLKGLHGYDFYNNDGDPTDDHGHGTHCAATIAAQANNLKGVAGVASGANVKIMALKMLGGEGSNGAGESTVYQTFGCFNYIHKAVMGGVNVVAANNSWGSGGNSTIYDDIISVLCDDGVICYVAASNDAADNDRTQALPTNSDCDNIVAVGAADITGLPAAFTNYGKTSVDVFGPGMNILSAVSYDNWFPMIYDAELFNATAAYYGEFNADTVVENGTITPSTGKKADETVKAFGSLQFVKQSYLDEDDDDEISDDAELELSVEKGRHFNSDNPYRLKITVKNAQCGVLYYIYFPYEKDPLTTGDDNTKIAVDAESVASSDGSSATFYAGEFYRDEDGKMTYGEGVITAGFTDKEFDRMEHHATNESGDVLLSAEDAANKEMGFGLCLVNEDPEEAHDASVYLDSIAISKPDIELEPNASYDLMSGTSQATPAVCGAGALLAALNPRQEGESGAAYAKRIKAKLFSCVRQTDVLADLCSTGGYVDLSLIDSEIPSVSDAVCDMESESIILTGENLFEGSTLTYRRMALDGAEEALPDDMPVEYTDDGSELIIHNAKRLFSTYTAFTVMSPNGMKGTGKFFLVKGQNKPDVIQTYTERDGVVIPYLLTDADGRELYGYNGVDGTVSRYDGEQFITYKNTNLYEVLRQYLVNSGGDAYTVYNDYSVTEFLIDVPTCEDGVIYKPLVVYIPQENDTDEEEPTDPAEDDTEEEEPTAPKDNDTEEEEPTAPEDDDTEEDEEESEYLEEHYLATFDLNSSDHHWHFSRTAQLPEGFRMDETYYGLTPAVYNGKLLCIGDPGTEGSTDSALPVYSYDPAADEWTQEPSLPYVSECFDIVRSNGKLYVMFGFDPDRTKTNEERILSSVWCFDGEKWEQKRDDLKYVGRINDAEGTLFHSDAITPVKNGLIFMSASVDGGGNLFLYNTDTDEIEPLYYSVFDSVCDAYDQNHSCVAARDGIYYLYRIIESNDEYSGWKLCLIPYDSGVYESPYENVPILGDADGDGTVTIADATCIQKHLAGLPTSAFVAEAADTDGDGYITITDATFIQKWLANLPSNENIGKPIR